MSNESERVTLTVESSSWIQLQSQISHQYVEGEQVPLTVESSPRHSMRHPGNVNEAVGK